VRNPLSWEGDPHSLHENVLGTAGRSFRSDITARQSIGLQPLRNCRTLSAPCTRNFVMHGPADLPDPVIPSEARDLLLQSQLQPGVCMTRDTSHGSRLLLKPQHSPKPYSGRFQRWLRRAPTPRARFQMSGTCAARENPLRQCIRKHP
jgi:hypothetical protein